MFSLIDAPKDFFYSKKFNYYQKVKGQIVVYVSEIIYGYQVQMYYTGSLGFCELEARTSNQTKDGYSKMFSLANEWLEKYSDGNTKNIQNDVYHISNPNGVWIKDRHLKKYWI